MIEAHCLSFKPLGSNAVRENEVLFSFHLSNALLGAWVVQWHLDGDLWHGRIAVIFVVFFALSVAATLERVHPFKRKRESDESRVDSMGWGCICGVLSAIALLGVLELTGKLLPETVGWMFAKVLAGFSIVSMLGFSLGLRRSGKPDTSSQG